VRAVPLILAISVVAVHLAGGGHGDGDRSRQVAPSHQAAGGQAQPAGTQFGIATGDILPFLTEPQLTTRLDQIAATGVTWVRLDLSWADVQPGGPHEYDWSRFDRIVTAARARHLTLLPTLAYTPAWARPRHCTTEKCAPANSTQFAAFARAAAARYAPDGITTWEIWNEENTPGFWSPTPSAAAYGALLIKAAAAIRAVEPKAFIISGGMAATLTHSGAINPLTFLRQLCTLGANRVINAVAYHPYTYPYLASYDAPFATAWNKIAQTKPSLVSILANHGTPRLPIWLTEYGAPTAGPGRASDGKAASITPQTTHVTLKRQATIAANAVRTAASSPDIGALFWYSDRDLGGNATNEGSYGLRHTDGTPKPALAAFRTAVQSASS
jgi:hypothetical protein